MALLDIIKELIGESVSLLYSDCGDDEQVEGKLLGIDTTKDPDEYPCHVIIQTDNKKRSVPVNHIKQFFPKNSLMDPNAEFFYIVLRYGKTERSKEHYYMSYDYNIKPGDQVLVWRDWRTIS